MSHRQRPGEFLYSIRDLSRNAGGQLPLTEFTGIPGDLQRLGSRWNRESTQHEQKQECSHDVLRDLRAPNSHGFFAKNARASSISVRVLSAPSAIAITLPK